MRPSTANDCPEGQSLPASRLGTSSSTEDSGESTSTTPVHSLSGAAMEQAEPAPSADRKSTRLNSSHRTISYAVFCLKKKKTTNTSELLDCEQPTQDHSVANHDMTAALLAII